jgi:hypothetical protein
VLSGTKPLFGGSLNKSLSRRVLTTGEISIEHIMFCFILLGIFQSIFLPPFQWDSPLSSKARNLSKKKIGFIVEREDG